MIEMTYSSGILCANAGRVKVAYYESEGRLKVIRVHDSHKLYDSKFTFTLTEFINEVKRYEKLCNPMEEK